MMLHYIIQINNVKKLTDYLLLQQTIFFVDYYEVMLLYVNEIGVLLNTVIDNKTPQTISLNYSMFLI